MANNSRDDEVLSMTGDARVLLVDENDDVLDGLSAWISGCPGFHVAGVAHSAREAYERIFLLSPDIVLMDVSLPDANALDVTRRIKSRAGAPLVILMTFHDITAVRVRAGSAGADACLSKPEITFDFPRVAGELWRKRQASIGLSETSGGPRGVGRKSTYE